MKEVSRFFYVAKAYELYHYFCVDLSKGYQRLMVGSSRSLEALDRVRRSPEWKEFELRNFDHKDFPNGITLRGGAPLKGNELEVLSETVPSVEELERMFKES